MLENDSPDSVAQAISEIASDPSTAKMLAENARISVERFAINQIVSNVASIYTEVIS